MLPPHIIKSKVRSDFSIFCWYTSSNFSFMDTVKMSFHSPTRPEEMKIRFNVLVNVVRASTLVLDVSIKYL